MTFPSRSSISYALALGMMIWAVPARADLKGDIGYTALANELGATLPTGAGVSATHCEAYIDGINYLPDFGLTEFSAKSFVIKSEHSGSSSHATLVGQYLYGGGTSIAPQMGSASTGASINLYSAANWIYSGFLQVNFAPAPSVETQDVANFSWVGSGGNEVTRRLDFAIQRDDFVTVVGLNNGPSTAVPELLANSYNALSVGLTNGNHSSGQTVSDGAGRVKPEIVVPSPEGFTSFATPVVGAAAGLLIEKARASTALNLAARSQTVRALLLAGCTKAEIPGWARTTTRPLDAHYGAGELNIQNSYHILVAGRQSASNNSVVGSTGWDFRSSFTNARRYFFDIPAGKKATTLSALLAWNRTFSFNDYNSPSVTDLSLRLFQATGTTVGAPVDSSTSPVDNLEHIYQTNLPAGRYVLEVTRPSGNNVDYGLAWQTVLIDLPAVTVATSSPSAAEGGAQPGRFTVSRTSTAELSQPLTVIYTMSGTAGNGVDYQTLAGSVTIPADTLSVDLAVSPLTDQVVEGVETATFTLSVSSEYVVGSPASATVRIADAPYQQWITENFLPEDWNDPASTGEKADPDFDGRSNLDEFFSGTAPLDSTAFYAPQANYADGQLQFTYRRNADATDVLAVPEVSLDLVIWDDSGSQIESEMSETSDGFTTTTLILAAPPEGRQFIRLHLER